MTTDDLFKPLLEKVLSRALSNFKNITSYRQLTAGASQETYCIECKGSDGKFKVALRRGQPTSESESSVGGISLAAEARLFTVATKHGIPSPKVLYELTEEDELGPGFFMNWLEGETMGHKINRAPELADVRPKLARQCGEILAQIHAIDYKAEKLDSFLDISDTELMVRECWDSYKALNVPIPMIDYTARWLLENIPTKGTPCLIHSDFRNGNLMVNQDGINAVLDWELARIGDPMQDLGYLCVNSWRFGNADKPVGGFGQLQDLLSGYESVSGVKVNEKDVHYWIVFGSFWWSVTSLNMFETWRTGETPSAERPVIGRRSSEAQMDCVNLLFPGDFTLPDVKTDLSSGTMMPMPAELMVGAIDFLQNTVAPTSDSHSSFIAKVVANSLGIAQREMLYGTEAAIQEKERLEEVTGKDGTLDNLRLQLVSDLQGDMALNNSKLQGHLRQTVATQLFIDQPKYSALKKQ